MKQYDVIVVGAGPAGCAAAKAAAEQGAKTVLLEEHTAIGVPQHCCGAFYPLGVERKRFKEFAESLDSRVVLTRYTKRVAYAPGGRIVHQVDVAGMGFGAIDRDRLDRELASRAVRAGADLLLNTRVKGLLKQDGRVIGVTTASHADGIHGKVVIAADGIHATQRGIPKAEGLARPRQGVTAGVSLELINCRDLKPEVAEMHFGAFCKKGWVTIWPRSETSCTTQFGSFEEYENVKKGDYPLSGKLRESVPLRIEAYSHGADVGTGLPRIVGDGLILAGAAGGWLGNWPSIVSGGYAGEVAGEAARQGDVGAEKLSRVMELSKELTTVGRPFLMAFQGLSDEAVEALLPKMVASGDVLFG